MYESGAALRFFLFRLVDVVLSDTFNGGTEGTAVGDNTGVAVVLGQGQGTAFSRTKDQNNTPQKQNPQSNLLYF